MSPAAKLVVEDVSMNFATPAGVFHALDHVSLAVPHGAFVSLIGPSGCGKSTIFNIVAGLQEPSAGRVLIDLPVASHIDAISQSLGREADPFRVAAASAMLAVSLGYPPDIALRTLSDSPNG